MYFKTRLDEALNFWAVSNTIQGALEFVESEHYILNPPTDTAPSYSKPDGILRMDDDDFSGDRNTEGVLVINGITSGRMEVDYDRDWFRIDVENAGEIYNFFAQGANGERLTDAKLELFQANNGIAYAAPGVVVYSAFGRSAAEIGFQFTEPGTYFISFTSRQGDYEITTTQITDDFANDISTTAILPTTGELVSGRLQHFLDSDWLTFDVTEDGSIFRFRLNRDNVTETEYGGFTPTIYIYNSSGELVDSRRYRTSNETIYDLGFSESGQYFVELRSPVYHLQSYTLSATRLADDDFLDNANTTGLITVDGDRVFGNIQYETDRDWFRLDIAQDDQHVQFNALSSNGHALTLAIYNNAGEMVRLINHEFFNRREYHLDHVFADAGEYFIEIRYTGTQDAIGRYFIDAVTLTDVVTLTNGSDDFTGDNSDNYIDGLAGNDNISGENGNNVIFGGAGNDILNGGGGFDVLNGGHGDDILHGGIHHDQLDGGDGNDFLYGGDDDDNLYGGNGNDYLEGGEHSDILNGGNGIDVAVYRDLPGEYANISNNFSILFNGTVRLIDGNGPLTFQTSLGVDTLIDIEIIDLDGTLIYLTDPDEFVFTDEIDVLFANESDDIVHAAGGGDHIHGQLGNDIIFGELGNDRLYGGSGEDSLFGGDGDDYLYGGADNDTLSGGVGGDVLYGDDGNDTLTGGAGDDYLLGGLGVNIIDGGDGTDWLIYAPYYVGVVVNLVTGTMRTRYIHADNFTNIENIRGSDYKDVLIGDDGDNIIEGGFGGDYIDGGDGIDTADYTNSGIFSVQVDLGEGTATNGPASGDLLLNIENLIGGHQSDTLSGDENDNVLEGGAGGDILNGRDGNDTASYRSSDGAVYINLATGEASGHHASHDSLTNIENIMGSSFDDTLVGDANGNVLTGGAGHDTMTGGDGVDIFVIGENAGQDVIMDFNPGEDILDLALSPYLSIDEVFAMFTDYDGYTLLEMGNGHSIRLEGLTLAELSLDDFALTGIPEDGTGPFLRDYVVMPEKGGGSGQEILDDAGTYMADVIEDAGGL